jgi:hypothetical protein
MTSKTSVTIKINNFLLIYKKGFGNTPPPPPSQRIHPIQFISFDWVTLLTAPAVYRILCPGTPTDLQSAYRTVHYATNSRFTVAKDWFLTSVTRRQENSHFLCYWRICDNPCLLFSFFRLSWQVISPRDDDECITRIMNGILLYLWMIYYYIIYFIYILKCL